MCLFHRVLGLPRPKRAQALNTRANAESVAVPLSRRLSRFMPPGT